MYAIPTLLFLSLFSSVDDPVDKPKYQACTVMAVKEQSSPTHNGRLEISVKAGGANYLVLYEPPSGGSSHGYSVGRQVICMVEKEAITFVDLLGRKTSMRILGKQQIEPEEPQPHQDGANKRSAQSPR
jgi:hypothetical protein